LIWITAITFSFLSPVMGLAASEIDPPPSSIEADEAGGLTLAANNRAGRRPQKSRKNPRSGSEIVDQGDPAYSRSTASLSSKTIVRGSLGLFLNDQSAIIFGGSFNSPMSKSVVLDGGGDYVSYGNEYVSVSLMRAGAGAAYVISGGPDSAFRIGGRAGLARVAVTVQLPSLFDEESTTYSDSEISFFGEARLAYEKALGAMTLSGEVQIPLIFGNKANGVDSIAIYGGLGFVL
jgi:hypothetical protein